MSKWVSAAIAAIALSVTFAGAVTAGAQSESSQDRRIYGYQDSQTGVFHAIDEVTPDAATTPTFTGTIEVTFHITIKSHFSKTPIIECGVGAVASSIGASSSGATVVDYTEEGYSSGTASSSTATCVVTIPYSWTLPQASATVHDSVTASYSVSATTGTAATGGYTLRSEGSSVLSLKQIPASGTVTKSTINVTL